MRSTKQFVRSLVGKFLPLISVGEMERSNGLMAAALELLMLNRLLIVPGVEISMLIIWVYLCLLALRPSGSMVLHGSRIMNAPGIL